MKSTRVQLYVAAQHSECNLVDQGIKRPCYVI